MIKTILKVLAVIVVFILVYNYFFGSTEEKATSQKIFQEVKEVGVAVKDLLKSEKEKYDSGKYDDALDKIGGVFSKLKTEAEKVDTEYLDRIADLEKRRQELKQAVEDTKDPASPPDNAGQDQLESDLQRLLQETDRLISDMEKSGQK